MSMATNFQQWAYYLIDDPLFDPYDVLTELFEQALLYKDTHAPVLKSYNREHLAMFVLFVGEACASA